MRRNYKDLYHTAPVTFVHSADPLLTDEQRRAIASRLAERWVEWCLARNAKPWIVFNAAWRLAIEMLKVVVVGMIALARALWRHYTRPRSTPNHCDHSWHPYAQRVCAAESSLRRWEENGGG
jgi:hypothetical protein